MNEIMPDENNGPRQSPIRYRIQIRKMKHGKVQRASMFVAQNFRVDRHSTLTYTGVKGELYSVQLTKGDYFDVKVMGA